MVLGRRRRWGLVMWGLTASWLGVDAGMRTVASADEPSAVELEHVLVTPRRIPGLFVDVSTFPGNATVITARDIAQSGATTIQELLARAEGVLLADAQGFGLNSDSTLNLRGIVNSSRTGALVVVDGVRQNRFTGDEVHWQSLPLEALERIEIIRGGGGLMYGEGALAGVINIVTKKGGDRLLETEERVEVGSFGWQKYAIAARGRAQRLTYGVTYLRRLLGGYREFSWSRNTTITTHGGVEVSPLARVEVNVLHSEDTTATPGGLTPAQAEARREQAVIDNVVLFDDETDQVSSDLILGPWQGLSAVFNVFWRNRVADSLRSNLFTITPSQGLSLRTSYEAGEAALKHLLISGIELMDDKATTGTRGSGTEDESHRKGYGLYLEDTVTFWERLSLIAGLRFDKFRYGEALSFPSFVGTLHFNGFSPKAGLVYSLIPKTCEVFASYSRPFKAPNVDDYSGIIKDFVGNINLRPQEANTYEVGLRLTRPRVRANATAFYIRTHDEILFNRLSGAFGQNDNFETRRVGAELGAHAEVPDRLRGSLAYTFVDAAFRKGSFSGHTIPGTPKHTLNTSVGISPVRGLWLDLDWELVNDFFRINDFNNILPADNYGVLNLTLQYELPEALTQGRGPATKAFLKIQNLTNEEYAAFQSSNGSNSSGAGENPAPPIGFFGGLTVKF
ncbi:MAG: TonB-dependent receptor [Candidatus Omnitrophica bacterium]|nr:TonB-dependent receptor [Candidatus Omnitrophota bacterium]